MKALLLVATVLAGGLDPSGPFGGLENARPPERIESFTAGLAARSHAPATGIVALRPPVERHVHVPGATFVMGSTEQEMAEAVALCAKEQLGRRCTDKQRVGGPNDWIAAEGHAHEVTVSSFDLDRTEITVERYGRCASAGGCAPASFPAGDARYDRADFPVTHVTWQDAQAFCTWSSGRLPTEAEWELAARGPRGLLFPWGNLYNARVSNHGSYAEEPSDDRDGFAGLAPVGSFPDGATASGLLDMAGNVAEWVSDWYDRTEEGRGYGRGAQTNPKGPSFGNWGHVVRGGSYRDGAHWLRTAARRASIFATREIGFRCAYDTA